MGVRHIDTAEDGIDATHSVRLCEATEDTLSLLSCGLGWRSRNYLRQSFNLIHESEQCLWLRI